MSVGRLLGLRGHGPRWCPIDERAGQLDDPVRARRSPVGGGEATGARPQRLGVARAGVAGDGGRRDHLDRHVGRATATVRSGARRSGATDPSTEIDGGRGRRAAVPPDRQADASRGDDLAGLARRRRPSGRAPARQPSAWATNAGTEPDPRSRLWSPHTTTSTPRSATASEHGGPGRVDRALERRRASTRSAPDGRRARAASRRRPAAPPATSSTVGAPCLGQPAARARPRPDRPPRTRVDAWSVAHLAGERVDLGAEVDPLHARGDAHGGDLSSAGRRRRGRPRGTSR